MRESHKQGFTLAEVLITLGIIGVVAAMTIPTLMNKTNDAEMKSGVRAAYSILSQATMSAATDNGGTFTGLWAIVYDDVAFKDVMTKYMKVSKDCGGASGSSNSTNAPIANGCWFATKNMDGSSAADYDTYTAGVILANGTSVTFRAHNPDCAVVADNCGWAMIDVNGAKPPNMIGKDCFQFRFYADGSVKPAGTSDADCKNSGDECAYKYLYH